MPLHDHFRTPGNRLPWRSLHSGWLGQLTERINGYLPTGYLALDTLTLEGGIEVDVGVEEEDDPEVPRRDTGGGGTAVVTAATVYQPPPATGTVQYRFPDVIELRVTSEPEGRLVAAVELVSPSNKDRPEKREAFLAKCVGYLAGGACVVMVDVVTERQTNLHNAILERLGGPDELRLSDEQHLYAVTYRPIVRKKKYTVDVWVCPLVVGAELPTMPLRVVAGLFVPVELEATYVAACRGRKFNP
jgi:hypothetical protein